MNIEIINASLVKEDYDILINFLDRMNFNYTTNEGEERKFSLKDMQDAIRFGADRANHFCGFPSELENYLTDVAPDWFKDKFNIDI